MSRSKRSNLSAPIYSRISSPSQITRAVPPSVPESYTISYSDRLHEKTRRDLSRLLADLDRWLGDYEKGIPFPHRKDCQTNCPYGKAIDLAEGNSLEAIGEINPFTD
jgi:hypothetical protein